MKTIEALKQLMIIDRTPSPSREPEPVVAPNPMDIEALDDEQREQLAKFMKQLTVCESIFKMALVYLLTLLFSFGRARTSQRKSSGNAIKTGMVRARRGGNPERRSLLILQVILMKTTRSFIFRSGSLGLLWFCYFLLLFWFIYPWDVGMKV